MIISCFSIIDYSFDEGYNKNNIKIGEITMVRNIGIFESQGYDPHYNIAIEKFLLQNVEPGQCILYLWQNQNTVVIGRNQNAWAECRTALLEDEGGKLARRLSGGGAVFHDLGNLNFTFLMRDEDYDLDKQFDVILTACRNLGIRAEKSGRNDLLAEGCKFSGNAFYHSQGRAYHHGTLLVDADMDKLSRYLTPSKAKLEAKGIQSVRSRVTNLKEFCPTLTCEILKEYLKTAFAQVYGGEPFTVSLDEKQLTVIEESAKELGDWGWCYGPKLPFSAQWEGRFSWGGIQIGIQAESGRIQDAHVFSDAMDWTVAEQVEKALQNCRYDLNDMYQAIAAQVSDPQLAKDIQELLSEQF